VAILKTLSQSHKKSALMKNLILTLTHKKQGDLGQAYRALYEYIQSTPPLSIIIEAYGLTCDEFVYLSNRYRALGFEWKKSDYIPVSVFCFAKPLEYILQNKDAFTESSYDRLMEVTYTSAELLNY